MNNKINNNNKICKCKQNYKKNKLNKNKNKPNKNKKKLNKNIVNYYMIK